MDAAPIAVAIAKNMRVMPVLVKIPDAGIVIAIIGDFLPVLDVCEIITCVQFVGVYDN
jgi:hypothetical protein